MGPILLAQLLGLNETQEGILNIAFKVADDQGLLLIDIKDLRAMLNYVAHMLGNYVTYTVISHNNQSVLFYVAYRIRNNKVETNSSVNQRLKSMIYSNKIKMAAGYQYFSVRKIIPNTKIIRNILIMVLIRIIRKLTRSWGLR